MPQLDELIAEAELGEQAKVFLESDLGRKLLSMAQDEVIAAQELLERVSPVDVEGIRKLQHQAQFGRKFEEWLLEIFSRGENAKQVFQQQSEE